ncbi:MAG: glycoside hydrolase family 99-like domain-containing protein, partial [Armatimonadetes bacterium]|nr:glycoside hydrolase family 99-like domain-containing protein [Armatimonadota bacterium]
LNLRRGFSIEARIRPTDLSDGRNLVSKADEYLLRTDWVTTEDGKLSFFVYLGGSWEPRVSGPRPTEGKWLHVVAIWDGLQSLLWVDGLPYQVGRGGPDPVPTNNPVEIGSPVGYGKGFVGDIEYVKIYSRALKPADVIRAVYGFSDRPQTQATTQTSFDFRTGSYGWHGRQGAEIVFDRHGLVAKTPGPGSVVLHDNLDLDANQCEFVTLRMAVDKGHTGTLIFATTAGAARMSFQVVPDGQMHTYVLEPWEHVGWGGRLIALGVAPSDAEGATARLEYVKLGQAPMGEPEVRLLSLYTQSVLPRAGRAEKLVARIKNLGASAAKLKAVLRVPKGVRLVGPVAQNISSLGYMQEKEVCWVVKAAAPFRGRFSAEVYGSQGTTPAVLSADLTFQPFARLPKAFYVPQPVPVKAGPYTVWTHYCPLWKHGTHVGWRAIEPYPERKPVLGWYNEGTPEVADWHIKMWVEHGISAVIYCWYRANKNGPVVQTLGHALHDGLLKARYLPLIKFAIMWENGCGQGVGSAEDLMENVLPFWLDNYFTHPQYLKIDGKPVLYVWVPPNVTRDLGGSEKVRATFEAMRQKCRERGLAGLYIVGCVGAANRELLEQMAAEGWDASSAYGNSWYPPKDATHIGDLICAPFEGFIDQQEAIWKAKTEWNLLPDITAAMMGWDSRPWSETTFFWSDNTPEKFRQLCLRAKAVMDSKTTPGPEKNTIIFCCWNEFGEGHYIEPTRGYGYSYLDVIREIFTSAPAKHVDIAPEDVGLGPYDSWYQQAKRVGLLSEVSEATSWRGRELGAWTGMTNLGDVKVTDEGLRAVSMTADSNLSSPPLKIRASKFSRIVVEMRVSRPGGAQLFWSTKSYPQMTEPASALVPTVADGQFHRYVFEVGRNEYWGGCVTRLRLDPTSEAGVTIEIASIALE